MKIFPYTRHQLGQLSRILFSVTVLEKMRFLVSWTLIQVTSKNETRFFSSKGEGGGGGRDAGIENLILSIKHLNSDTSPQTAMCMHTHFLSQTTPKKRVGKLPILIGNYKGKISHLCRKNLVSTDGQHNTALKS